MCLHTACVILVPQLASLQSDSAAKDALIQQLSMRLENLLGSQQQVNSLQQLLQEAQQDRQLLQQELLEATDTLAEVQTSSQVGS